MSQTHFTAAAGYSEKKWALQYVFISTLHGEKPCLHAVPVQRSRLLSTLATASDSPPCGCTAQTYHRCQDSHHKICLAGTDMMHLHSGTSSISPVKKQQHLFKVKKTIIIKNFFINLS